MTSAPDDQRIKRFRELWADELAGAAMYRALAKYSDPARSELLLELAESEDRHAEHWAKLLAEAGYADLRAPRLPMRVKVLSLLSRRFGVEAVLPLMLRMEASGVQTYQNVPEATSSMIDQERSHGRVVAAMQGSDPGTRIARSEGRHRSGAGGALRAAV